MTLLLSSYSCVCCESALFVSALFASALFVSPLFVSPLFTDLACFQIAEHFMTDVCEIPVNQLCGAGFC
jgi:hypothetical protein